MYLLSQTAEQYTMLPLLSGWRANTKKPLLGKAEAATAYLSNTDFIALHLTITDEVA